MTHPLVLPGDIRLLSLDVFDTALIRDVCQPSHVFCRVQRALARGGQAIRDFAGLRLKAEELARQVALHTQRQDEVSLDAIYRQLRAMTQLPLELIETAREAEIEAELACVRADPDILALYQEAARQGVPVVFLSDMYLPEAVIGRMLVSCGYAGCFEVFASSGRLVTKSGGGLYRLALETFELHPSKMLHAGDDPHADVAVPEALGIRTLPRLHHRRALHKARPLSPDVLPLSRLKAAHWSAGAAGGDTAAIFRFLGESYGTVIHGAFIRWIVESALANGADLLLFFSRDGYILKKLYDGFRRRHPHLPPSAYCCVSRYTLRTASLAALEEPDYSFLLSGLKPKTALHVLRRCRLSLAPEEELRLLASHGLQPDDLVSEKGETSERARQVLKTLEAPLRQMAARQRASLDGYLRRFVPARFTRIATVDVGWTGSSLRCFEQAALRLGHGGKVLGLFFGLLSSAAMNRARGQEILAFLPELSFGRRTTPIMEVISLLEPLHAAPHGGVTGYDFREGAFRPRFADNPLEIRQYEEKIAVYHAAVLRGVSGRSLMDPAFAADSCREALKDLCEHPTPLEASALGELVHFDGFEHNSGGQAIAPAVPPGASPEVIQAARDHAYWNSGFAARNGAPR
jgi:FMN phosphatase YigB (HAD superfamily)